MVDFSVIIPTRNRPQFLVPAVESVLAQAGVSLEVLIVDDGTVALPSFKDARVTILNNDQRGPVPARNLGIASAAGEFIAFLDDDDWWMTGDFLSRSLHDLRSASDFTFADGVLMFEDGSSSIPFAFDADATSLETNNSILISGVCYARHLHGTLGQFDEQLPYYWDWDWYLRVACSGIALKRLAKPLVAIRVHPGNMSSPDQEKARRENLSALEAKHGLAPLILKNHLSLAKE